ncbi:hypothetical protein AVEN_190229-1 [Araneus ventricosus]|uniref:Uncharacterized protein n=1 Tax=Araneus ventricosus TaxID=182803 RepID=A0A4Y2FFK3_ARAVE|nr:hypothetical protein AVEN_190229-1 [Araneus ventricosus]
MLQNFYTLPDLVDLALKVPEIGAVNFNILHIVLQTLIAELRLHNVRPMCHIENPHLAQSALKKAKLQRKTAAKEFDDEEAIRAERPPPQTPPPATRQKVEKTPSKSEEKAEKEPELPITREEVVSEEIEREPHKETEDLPPEAPPDQTTTDTAEASEEAKDEPPEEKPEPEEETPKSQKDAAGWDDILEDIRSHPKSNHVEDKSKPTATKDQVKEAWSLDDIRSDSENGDTLPHQDESSSDFSVDEGPQPFSQRELNDLVRNLGLSKDGAELLGSRLKNKNLLTPGTSFSWHRRHREKEFTQFFSKEGNLVFCNDVQGLKKCFDIECDLSELRLSIDSSKTTSNQSCCIKVIHLHRKLLDTRCIWEKTIMICV